MRTCGTLYDQAERAVVSVRGGLHRALLQLFCDYSFDKDFLYTISGRALVDRYGANPYRIVRAGKARFEGAMRRRAPHIRQTTLDRLWDNAQTSARHEHAAQHADLLELQVRQLWEEFLLHEQRKIDLEKRLTSLLQRLRHLDPQVPAPTPGVISAKNLARLVGETGPLGDFTSWRMLLRYAGINIRMRQSGIYKGQNRITKKGRPLLRKILSQIVLPLVRRKCLYGVFYHRKRLTMPGQKAMVVVMRSFLRKLHGWYRSARAFDAERFFTDHAEYRTRRAA
jgi:transposase